MMYQVLLSHTEQIATKRGFGPKDHSEDAPMLFFAVRVPVPRQPAKFGPNSASPNWRTHCALKFGCGPIF